MYPSVEYPVTLQPHIFISNNMKWKYFSWRFKNFSGKYQGKLGESGFQKNAENPVVLMLVHSSIDSNFKTY